MSPNIVVESVEPAQAYERWRAHRDRFAQTGLWPILLEPEEVAWMLEAAAHGGTIEVASRVDQGAAFTVVLPLAA